MLAAFIAIIANRAVSTGHSLMIAVGAALVLVPYISTFEWSDKSFKFTTRQEAAELAKSLAQAAKEEINLREQVSTLAQGLQAATLRISALETKTGNNSGQPSDQLMGSTFEDWIKSNEISKDDALNRWGKLQGLEQQLIAPTMQ